MDWTCFLNIELSFMCVVRHLWAVVHQLWLRLQWWLKKTEAANHLHGNNAHVQTHLLEE